MSGSRWTAADLPDLSGRTVVVTGASGGLGEIIAAELAGAYRDAKLANTLFTLELTRRLTAAGSAIRAVTSDPGFARTGLAAHVGGVAGGLQRLAVRMFNDAARGAAATLYAATADIPSGSYVAPTVCVTSVGTPRSSTRRRPPGTSISLGSCGTSQPG